MKLQKYAFLILAIMCFPKDNVYGFDDTYYDCLGPGPADSGKMLKCMKVEQNTQLKQIKEDLEYVNDHIHLSDNKQNLRDYINSWEKYSQNLCQYFSFAFDYIDGKKISTEDDSKYQYEYCRMIEISAMKRRIEELKDIISSKENN